MKISKEKPKIYDRLHKEFGVQWGKGICIVWGDTCFSKNDIRDDLLAHEEVHVEQQKLMGPEIWWETYINDRTFRLNQEVEAYRAQIKFIKEHPGNSSRDLRRHVFRMLAKELAGSMYGNIISEKKALELLK